MAGESPSGQSELMLAGLTTGSVVAGYRVESRVGAGGMAVVFRAYDEGLGRTVALKILAPALADDAEFRERFIRESRAVAAVDHPHIIPVYAAGEADGVLYLAMRFVPGGDLRALLGREGPLTGDRAIALLAPIASALDIAHAEELVHRDVKPANILVDVRPGRPDHPYLSDFGLVKGAMASAGLTRTGQFLGTPNYVAPEQISGKPARPQTDQYSLACVAYNLLTGTLPFARDDSMAVLWAHMYEPPPSLAAERPDQPPAVDEVLARALAKSPEDRYATCGEFVDALRTAFGAETAPSPAATAPEPERGSGAAASPPHTATAIALPPPDEAAAAEEPASQPVADDEPVTVTVRKPAATAPTSQPAATAPTPQPTAIDPPAPPPRKRFRERRRAMVAAIAAGVVVVGVAGGLLLAHPWTQPVLKPTGLTVRSATTGSSGTADSAEIAWSGPATGPLPNEYEIFSDGTEIGTVLGTETSYTANGLTPDTSYRFQVIAVRGGAQSPVSATLTAQMPPLRPTGLSVKHATTDSLEIAWSSPAAGPPPANYEILRDSADIATVPGSITSYTDNGLAPDTAYSYQVIAITGGENSPASAALSSAQTAKPPLSSAVLNWSGQVTEKTTSLYPSWPDFNPQPGSSTHDTWSIAPDCSSGPCDATLTGTYDGGYSLTAKLSRSGATYTGTAKVEFHCVSESDTYSGTVTIKIAISGASTQGNIWTATSLSGQETVNTPAAYTCIDATAQLDVRSG